MQVYRPIIYFIIKFLTIITMTQQFNLTTSCRQCTTKAAFAGLLSAVEAQPKGTEEGEISEFIDVSNASNLWTKIGAESRREKKVKQAQNAQKNNAAEKAVIQLKTVLRFLGKKQVQNSAAKTVKRNRSVFQLKSS